jgi:hypothetical protein
MIESVCSVFVWVFQTSIVLLLISTGMISGNGIAVGYAFTPLITAAVMLIRSGGQVVDEYTRKEIFVLAIAGFVGGIFIEWTGVQLHAWYATWFVAIMCGAVCGRALFRMRKRSKPK